MDLEEYIDDLIDDSGVDLIGHLWGVDHFGGFRFGGVHSIGCLGP